eukprot:COSAG02_NODE_2066_length_9960_cov_3.087009_3_plen_69_part_00
MARFELSEAQRYRLLLLFIRADTSKEGSLSMQVSRRAVEALAIWELPTAGLEGAVAEAHQLLSGSSSV